MTPILRPYQDTLVTEVRSAWSRGARNVLMRSATGSGKTVMLGALVEAERAPVAVIAHRAELTGQLSLCLARYGIRHDLIMSDAGKRAIAALHVAETGQCWFTPGAMAVVCSVDTLVRRTDLASWASQVRLWVTDEGHHLVHGNKWDSAIKLFTHPEVRGLLPTATPSRSDGKGLGRHADGVADHMVEGPPERWLINNGYLADYRIVCVDSDLKALIEAQAVAASGDWSPEAQRDAARKSHIVSDVVKEYLRHASGMLACTFCVSIEAATATAEAFRTAGIPAEVLTGKTDDHVRRQILRRFAAREIMQLCSVDIVSEGFDLPAIECVQMARPTQSLGLYRQQIGRGMRPKDDGAKCLVIDHVGNVLRHGLPDRPVGWTLNRRDRKAGVSDAIPLRVCLACFQPYPRIEVECPWCGEEVPPPASRSAPIHVEGDLTELSPEVLAHLRGEATLPTIEQERARLAATGLPDMMVRHNLNNLHARAHAQEGLRDAMAAWGGIWHARGECDRTIQRRFFWTYGMCVLEAMALPRAEADALRAKVDATVI